MLAVLSAFVVTACDRGERGVAPERASKLVLRVSDLPPVFTVFDNGAIQARDTPAALREDPSRFGRRSGWKARFRRAGDPETSGPFVVESRADVFSSTGGAEDELSAYRVQYEETLGADGVPGRRLGDPELGEEAVVFTLLQESGFSDVRFYAVAWRIENVVGSLLVSGFEPKLSLPQTLALAEKQAIRIRRELR